MNVTDGLEQERLIIRLAQQTDLGATRSLTNRSWLATYSPLIGEQATRDIVEDRHSEELFASQLADPESVFLVAEAGGRIVGHCYAFPKDGFYIDRLHVDPAGKGRGIGRALLSEAESRAPANERSWLDVLKGNDGAVAFYKRVGYSLIGETDACGGLAGIPALVFEKRP